MGTGKLRDLVTWLWRSVHAGYMKVVPNFVVRPDRAYVDFRLTGGYFLSKRGESREGGTDPDCEHGSTSVVV